MRLFCSYCRLLPPRPIAKLLEGNKVTGAGDGNRTHVRNLGSCRHLASETIPKWQNQGGGFGALQAPATIRMRFLEAGAFFARRLVYQVCQSKGGSDSKRKVAKVA